jgi:hypothetical protein
MTTWKKDRRSSEFSRTEKKDRLILFSAQRRFSHFQMGFQFFFRKQHKIKWLFSSLILSWKMERSKGKVIYKILISKSISFSGESDARFLRCRLK